MAASNRLGDTPGNRWHAPELTNSAVASNGATSRIGQMGPFPYDIRPRAAWWTPTGADQAATITDSYRRLALCNGGAAGTGTAIIASLNLTASHASLAPVALTVDTTGTVASGNVVYFKQITVGGTDANGTVLVAGIATLDYEII